MRRDLARLRTNYRPFSTRIILVTSRWAATHTHYV
jgi:hypothetical protein